MSTAPSEEAIWDALRAVKDPEIGRDLVSLNMVKGVAVSGGEVTVAIELTTPACPLRAQIQGEVERAVRAVAGVESARVELSASVARRRGQTPDPRRLPGVRNVIAVASGKGGVGKSTVAVNLALALSRHGARVGILDADIYGPSVPQMLGEPEEPPQTLSGERIQPARYYGTKVMSVGFFVERGVAVVWRGPMVHKLLTQFLEDVEWGELDYLVVDLPPGTGDAQLSLTQLIPVTGAVMVTTPQEVAVIDVAKGITMFRKVEVPVLGIVENMSYYQCPKCGHRDEIFDRGGGEKLAAESEVPFLGEIPIDTAVRRGGDAGKPVVVADPDGPHARIFLDLAAQLAGRISITNLAGAKRGANLTVV